MKKDILYIVPKGTFGDKNDNLQLVSSEYHCNEILSIVRGIGQWNEYPQFEPLNLFIQGDSKQLGSEDHWIMIEHWSFDSDLFFEFCEFISNMSGFPLEIGLK